MTLSTSLSEAEFASIEATIRRTLKGRSFLAEHSRRERARILAGIDRFEACAAPGRPPRGFDGERAAEVAYAATLPATEPTQPQRPRKGGLNYRFAALVQLDAQDPESGLMRFAG